MEYESDKSVFNVSLQYLLDLNKLLNDCNELSENDLFIPWYKKLQRVYISIECVMSEGERKQHAPYIKAINECLSINNEPNTMNVRGALGSYELFLRRVCYNHELILSKKEKASMAFAKGTD